MKTIFKLSIIILVISILAHKEMEVKKIKEECSEIVINLEREIWFQKHKYDSLQTCTDVELLIYSNLAK